MRSAPTTEELGRFRDAITGRIGLRLTDERLAALAAALPARVQANGDASVDAYLTRFRDASTARDELRGLAPELTVGETFFFRGAGQLAALTEVVLPGILREPGTQTIRILSAGCASGEEAYSIALSMIERSPDIAPFVEIHGIDVNPLAVEKARRARYSAWSLRDAPRESRARWFSACGRDLALDETARRMVTFAERNLAEDDTAFWSPGSFDVVFCRNVLMYFSEGAARALLARIAHSLAPRGYLFLGHAETTRGLSDAYDLCEATDAFYYRLSGAARSLTGRPTAGVNTRAETLSDHTPLQLVVDPAETLVGPHRAADAGPALGAPRLSLDDVLELFQRDRPADALARLRELPQSAAADPKVQILLAIALTNVGEVQAAGDACRRVLATAPSSAGAHYLLALCCESAGDLAAAARHDRAASALDPSFPMPRLHLALLCRRSRDLPAARVELDRALALLGREQESRIILYGGGFQRDALVELCRAELHAITEMGG